MFEDGAYNKLIRRGVEGSSALPIGSKVVLFWGGFLVRILQGNPKKELLWSPWVEGPEQFEHGCGVLANGSARYMGVSENRGTPI